AQLEDRHAGDGIEDLFLGGHYCSSPCCSDSEDSSVAGASAVASGAGLSATGSEGSLASPSVSGGSDAASGAGLSASCSASASASASAGGASTSTTPPC